MRAWDNFVQQQEQELGTKTVEKWLKTLNVVRFDAANLYLEAKDAFQILWFEEHMRKKAQTQLLNNNKRAIKVHLSVSGAAHDTSARKRSKTSKLSTPAPEPAFTLQTDTLDPLCTFENYVETEAAILAFKLLSKATGFDGVSKTFVSTDNTLSSFNPIYLFGKEGTGKTHLMMATAHALQNQGKKVCYVRATTFTENLVAAMRSTSMTDFRLAYRDVDALLIDDVHLFAKKIATQEELFHTFNTLHMAGKQILLASSLSPSELQHIEPRIVSRFEWGIVLPLAQQTEDDFLKILHKKAEALDVRLHPKVLQYLSTTFNRSTKSLIKALEALILRHHMQNKEVKKAPLTALTTDMASYMLKDLAEEEQKNALNPEKIIGGVAQYFGIRGEDVVGKAQNKEFCLSRQIAMYLCRNKLKLPYTKIGEIFSRDHSTVMSSVKIIQNAIENHDKEILTRYSGVIKQLS